MSKVSVIGSMNCDTTIHVERFPLPGETISAKGYAVSIGGKGANQAAALAKAGLAVEMYGAVGNDEAGEQMLHALEDLHVGTQHVQRSERAQTGQAFITVENSGNNHIMIVAGANGECTSEYADANAADILSADAVLAQLEIPVSTVLKSFKLAKDKGILTVLNPAPAQHFRIELLDYTDILVPNESEMETLYGREIRDHAELEKACEWLAQSGVSVIIVTLGSKGCYVYHGGQGSFHTPYRVKVVDTTAAGDSFIGSFLAAYLEEKQVLPAIDYAQKVASITVSREGAIQSIPSKEEVAAYQFEM